MMIIRQLFIILLGFAMITQAAAQEQVITINTHFRSIDHKPTWLLIVRNLQTGEVIPHLFTMQKKEQSMVFGVGQFYRITASNMTFRNKTTKNFCGLESGVIDGKSLFVTITGDLQLDPKGYQCRVIQYRGV